MIEYDVKKGTVTMTLAEFAEVLMVIDKKSLPPLSDYVAAAKTVGNIKPKTDSNRILYSEEEILRMLGRKVPGREAVTVCRVPGTNKIALGYNYTDRMGVSGYGSISWLHHRESAVKVKKLWESMGIFVNTQQFIW